MKSATRYFVLALIGALLTTLTFPVLTQNIEIDSGFFDTVFTSPDGRVGIGTASPSSKLHIMREDVQGSPPFDAEIGVEGGSGDDFIADIRLHTAPDGRARYGFSYFGVDAIAGLYFNASDGSVNVIQANSGGGGLKLHDFRRASLWRLNNSDYPLHIGDSSTSGNGAHVTEGGVWTNGSDRNSKQDFQPIDRQDILSRLAELPINQWRYIGESDQVSHIGPVAQDFSAAFGLGHSDKHIGTVDADGVALAAIQGLYEMMQEKDKALSTQKAQIAELTARLQQLELRLSAGAKEL